MDSLEPLRFPDSEDLRTLQDERLAETVERAYENVPYYRERLDDHGVTPSDVDGVDDVEKLPLTTKAAFTENYPDGLFAVDDAELRRIHASSGTTGKPKVVGYTEGDLDVWERVMARGLATAGVEPGDTVQNMAGYGLFTGGLGVHDAIERLGATVVPTGSGATRRQVELMVDLDTDAVHCTPSYALYLAETAEEMGHDPADLPVSTVVFGAESSTEAMREEIGERFDATAVDNYGLSEIIGPGVAIECAEGDGGLHVWEDHFYPEIVDPDTGEPVPEGEEGELVLTTLTKEALPMLRYRTGDVTSFLPGECPCGCEARRIGSITGRTDDLLVVRGVNVYPTEIESVLLEFDAVAPYYRVDLYRDGSMDTIEITVEREGDAAVDPDELESRLSDRLADVLTLTPDEVAVVDPGALDRTETGKVKRVFDHRE
ncbi:phenylacetate--CoA ligase PaaK [Halobium palmae]|uniref:Phenylacetate--CoA ligase PaaK n=1 Tax=Halobium palmae TaxID=1776492 RepID=A0ABD5RX80_9EURY